MKISPLATLLLATATGVAADVSVLFYAISTVRRVFISFISHFMN